MSRTNMLGTALYEAESSWGEDVATFATRVATLGPIDVSGLEQSKQDAERTVQYAGERTMPIRGVKGGSFSIRLWLAGHGSSTSGATALTALGNLLGNAIGNAAVSAASGTTLTGSTDADTWAATASDTFTDGSMCFLGAIGDGDGEGEAFLIESHTGTAIQVANAAAGAPANGAVLYSAETIYPTETPSSLAVASTRWQFLSANQQYDCHGCFPTAIAFDFPFGGQPSVTITYGVSWWEETASGTFPSSTSVDTFNPAPIAAGQCFFNTFGTRTRAVKTLRSFGMTVNLNVIPVVGPGGVDTWQNIIGAVRGPYECMLEWTEDVGTASASPTLPGQWDSDDTFRHMVFTLNRGAASGKKVGLAFRKLYLDGRRPVQVGVDGINRYQVSAHACTDTSGSTDILKAAFLIALG